MRPIPSLGARARPDPLHRRLLRALHGARERGDDAAAKAAWRRILEAELPRVRGIIAAFRHEALPGGKIPAADRDDVTTAVFMRLHEKSGSLRGQSVGELRTFMRTATDFACRDYLRAHVREDRHRGGSLDSGGAEGFGPSAATQQGLAKLAAELAEQSEHADVHRAMVHVALADVAEDKRVVLVMDAAGYSVEEITERLGISRDNVYQRRKRGLAQLGRAIRERAEKDED